MLLQTSRIPSLALALCLATSSAAAQNIEYTFTGTVTSVNSPTGVFSSVVAGDLFTVTAQIDGQAPGSGDPTLDLYPTATLSAEITIGGITSSVPLVPDASSGLTVADDLPSTGLPTCTDSVSCAGYGSSDYVFFRCSVRARDFSGVTCPTVFSSTSIPLSLDIADFDLNTLSVRTTSGIFLQISGLITGVDVAVTPVNDDCADATPLPSSFADTLYDATGATTDGLASEGLCDYGSLGDDQNHNDVWFTYTPNVGGCTYISTLGLSGYDTRLTIYDGYACPDEPLNIIACVDRESLPGLFPFEAGLDVDLEAGDTYTIRLGTYAEVEAAGVGVLRIAAGPVAGPSSIGNNPGAPGCDAFLSFCSGNGGDQMGCSDCPCGNNIDAGKIGGCRNSLGTGARLFGSGDPSVSLPANSMSDLRFAISGAPPLAFCILNSGDGLAPANMANPCFGLNSGGLATVFDGLRCAIMNTRRHGGRSADGFGDVGVTNNPWGGEGGPPVGIAVAGGGFAAGQTRFFQVINRDNPLLSCMRGLNTSQALRVTFQP